MKSYEYVSDFVSAETASRVRACNRLARCSSVEVSERVAIAIRTLSAAESSYGQALLDVDNLLEENNVVFDD